MGGISPELQRRLLAAAREAIQQRLQGKSSTLPELEDWPEPARTPGASFVTLKVDDRLRGCIGSIEPVHPLVHDVCDNAAAAAFRDPRFPPLTEAEYDRMQISISVLGEPQDVKFSSTRQLEALLRPGVDGLILAAGKRRAVFLPQVWESLPQPREFIQQLKLKARLEESIEPPQLSAQRFQVQHF